MHLTRRSILHARRRFLLFPVLAVALLAAGPAAGGKKKDACPAERIYIQEVAAGRIKGLDPEDILPELRASLELTLEKKGFLLVEEPSALEEHDVAVKVSVRAWTDRAPFTGRVTTGMAARVEVGRHEARLWSDHVAPGERSRLKNFNNGSPKDLGKRVASLVVEACAAGWTTPD